MLQFNKHSSHGPRQPSTPSHPPQDAKASSSSTSSSSSLTTRHDHHLHHHQHQHQLQLKLQVCAGCQQVITDRYLLKAVDETWHEECLRCSSCNCCLGRDNSSLFTRDGLLLCRHDYLRLYGVGGICSGCMKMIPAFEMVMRAADNVYHLDCFYCVQCKNRFCVGDRYYVTENSAILCEYDYHLHQRQQNQVSTWLATADSACASSNPQFLRRNRVPVDDDDHQLLFKTDKADRSSPPDSPVADDASSGYGSPSPDAKGHLNAP